MSEYHQNLINKKSLPLRKSEEDWIGEKYGDSIVVGKVDADADGYGHRFLKQDHPILLCKCGNEFTSPACTLNKLRKTHGEISCGSCRSGKGGDWIGKTLRGMKCLKYKIEKDLKEKSRRRAVLECEVCGNQKVVCLSSYVNLDVSCSECVQKGCGSQRLFVEKPTKPSRYFSVLKSGAIKRGLIVEITLEWILTLLESQNNLCLLSGLPISFENGTASLDRIDSLKGYTKDNVQWIHRKINFMKGVLSQHEFIDLCSKISIRQSD